MCPRFDVPHIVIQDRDLLILRGLFESRIMNLDHIAVMYFGGRREAAQKRVQKLRAAGYLAERHRRPYERALLFITRKAFDALRRGGHLAIYPPQEWSRLRKRLNVSPYTIAHETAVLDVKAAFMRAVAGSRALAIDEFCTWPAMLQFTAAPRPAAADVLVKPDGFIRLRETRHDDGCSQDHHFYLEVDRSTEPQGTLVLRAACYRNHQRRGTRPMSTRPVFPFRLLMVFKTDERRDSTAQHLLLLNPPILSQVWLATHQDVIRNPLGDVWLCPIDYRRSSHPSNRRPLFADLPPRPKVEQLQLLESSLEGDTRTAA